MLYSKGRTQEQTEERLHTHCLSPFFISLIPILVPKSGHFRISCGSELGLSRLCKEALQGGLSVGGASGKRLVLRCYHLCSVTEHSSSESRMFGVTKWLLRKEFLVE